MRDCAKIALSIFCSLGLLTGCAYGDNLKQTTEIKVAFNQNEKHPQYIAMKQLGERFEEETNGRYTMKIYPNGVLGDQNAVAEFIRTGALQMAIVPCTVPESYDSDFAIVGAPYLYDDMEHLKRVSVGGVFDELFKSTRKFRFEVLTVYTAGERNVYSKYPINSVENLKGKIVRVNNSPTYIEMVELMGGTGAVMAQSDVYTALQQGVIDAGENSEQVYRDFKHYEVAPYYSYTKHIVHPDVVIASTEFLDLLSDEDRAIFDELIKESTEYEFEAFKNSVAQAKIDAQEAGAKFCYPDVNKLRESCQPLLDRISSQSDVTRNIYENVVAMREKEE